MQLLPTQVSQIVAVIDGSPFERQEIQIDQASGQHPILRFAEVPTQMWCVILGHADAYAVNVCPGEKQLEQQFAVGPWDGVLRAISVWLHCVHRERVAAERLGAPSVQVPKWALEELPAAYHELVVKIETLQEEERRTRRMTGLLFETGDLLDRLGRDCFRGLEFRAELTAPGETYDLDVDVPPGRLLIEVTGIEGHITKGSKKIAQVLGVLQSKARATDRVCVAVNAYRDRPVRERAKLEVVTPDALSLLTNLNAVVITTAGLFEIWKLSLSNSARARKEIERIHGAPAGILRIGDAVT